MVYYIIMKDNLSDKVGSNEVTWNNDDYLPQDLILGTAMGSMIVGVSTGLIGGGYLGIQSGEWLNSNIEFLRDLPLICQYGVDVITGFGGSCFGSILGGFSLGKIGGKISEKIYQKYADLI